MIRLAARHPIPDLNLGLNVSDQVLIQIANEARTYSVSICAPVNYLALLTGLNRARDFGHCRLICDFLGNCVLLLSSAFSRGTPKATGGFHSGYRLAFGGRILISGFGRRGLISEGFPPPAVAP